MISLISRFTGPTWGPSGADRTQDGPISAQELFYLGWHSCRTARQWKENMFDNNDNLSNDTHSNNWLYPSLIKMRLITFAKLRRLCFHLGLFGWLFLAKMRWCGVFQFAALFVYLDGQSRVIQHVHLSLVQIFIWFQGWRPRSRGHRISRKRKYLTLLLSYIKTCSPTYCKTCVHDIINLRYYFEFAHFTWQL